MTSTNQIEAMIDELTVETRRSATKERHVHGFDWPSKRNRQGRWRL